MVTLADIKADRRIGTLIDSANAALAAIGYTDHGPRHVGYVSKVTSDILRRLGYPERTCELGAVAGWVHDVGNLVNRKNHGAIGATLLFRLYVVNFGNYNQTYGTIGAVIVLLTWMYLSMLVVLIGGELTSELHKGTGAMWPHRGAVLNERIATGMG